MDFVTYSLREYESTADSGGFYAAADQLTDRMLGQAKRFGVDEIVRLYRDGPQERYIFELLALGVLWRAYKENAVVFPTALSPAFRRLYQMRSAYSRYKPAVDRVRGLLSPILCRRSKTYTDGFTPAALGKLLIWMEATCEYREESRQFRKWEQFFSTHAEGAEQLRKTELFAEWFETESQADLGRFTQNVHRFLEKEYPKHQWKEDAIFCGKSITEYHLNIVGATIMNRIFRDRFLRTKRRIVLLPFCMSIHAGGGCRAVRRGKDILCAGCTDTCRINRIRRLGMEFSFDVFIVPHSSGFTKWLEQWRDQDHTGVVAAACVLNLLSGGYEMERMNIPAQCVFLDYCGCKKHWCENDVPTDLDEKRLLQIVKHTADGR